MNYFLKCFIPGLILIAMAFFSGMQKNATLGLFAFLAFFIVGITLIIEGWRKRNEGSGNSDQNK